MAGIDAQEQSLKADDCAARKPLAAGETLTYRDIVKLALEIPIPVESVVWDENAKCETAQENATHEDLNATRRFSTLDATHSEKGRINNAISARYDD